MIVLLPLRGWTGDAMATQMASMTITSSAIESGAARVHEMGPAASVDHQNQVLEAAPAMPDCHEQAAAQSKTIAPASSATDNNHCGTCQACQACHTLALSPSPVEAMASFASPQLRPTSAAVFTSAAAALGQKPPIS
jgi:hypothetical protein